jgi:hypothetical protein
MSADAKEFSSSIALSAHASEPLWASAQDRRNDRDSLNIGHSRRATVETNVCWKRRLQARLALTSLERLEYCQPQNGNNKESEIENKTETHLKCDKCR